MPNTPIVPTASQAEIARLVEAEFVEVVQRLSVEGVGPDIVLAGLASACTRVVETVQPGGAARWFARQAQILVDIEPRGSWQH